MVYLLLHHTMKQTVLTTLLMMTMSDLVQLDCLVDFLSDY